MTGSVITVKEDETYIAKDVCTCVASQGKTAEKGTLSEILFDDRYRPHHILLLTLERSLWQVV